MPPITPQEAAQLNITTIPDEVFEVVNTLLAEKLLNGRATVLESNIVNALEERGIDRAEVYRRGWLNFESAYQAVGWRVEYDKPGYNETYPARYTFRTL